MDDFELDREKNKYLIPNIARALKIIEYLAKVKNEASITEISDDFDYPKNSVFRILNTLEYYGYVEETQRKYKATPRLLYLGYAGMRNNGITENSIDIMHSIRDELNETVMLGTLLGNEIVIIEQLPSFQYIKFTTEIGHRVNIHTSAPGKAIAAYLPEMERADLLSHLTFTRFTNGTIPSQSEMNTELEKVKERGFAIDNGEEISEIHCVGAPVFDYRNYPIAAVWCSGPAFRMGEEKQNQFGERIKVYAMQISRRFGYDPGEN
ncbi:MAG: IclR family transcriptional regulator [Spirochaetales bacterium]|uniref:IclR family transcriptional regulator n=1 Tax=Candidatus Thalassospirochaeta sargassi TaxID=3119039 RepID=A0AAJ1IEJ0_9SPIO|nr:IclR family transcriptional regulator [Spirochaetales bacterium]